MRQLGIAISIAMIAVAATSVTAETIDCRVFATEDASASGQRRQRVFVATESPTPEDAMALGYIIATEAVMARGLDFVDVFVTRLQDGLNRADHNMITSLAWVRFNPGKTPVTDTRLEGTVVTGPVRDSGEMAIIAATRRDATGIEINGAYWTTGKGRTCSRVFRDVRVQIMLRY